MFILLLSMIFLVNSIDLSADDQAISMETTPSRIQNDSSSNQPTEGPLENPEKESQANESPTPIKRVEFGRTPHRPSVKPKSKLHEVQSNPDELKEDGNTVPLAEADVPKQDEYNSKNRRPHAPSASSAVSHELTNCSQGSIVDDDDDEEEDDEEDEEDEDDDEKRFGYYDDDDDDDDQDFDDDEDDEDEE